MYHSRASLIIGPSAALSDSPGARHIPQRSPDTGAAFLAVPLHLHQCSLPPIEAEMKPLSRPITHVPQSHRCRPAARYTTPLTSSSWTPCPSCSSACSCPPLQWKKRGEKAGQCVYDDSHYPFASFPGPNDSMPASPAHARHGYSSASIRRRRMRIYPARIGTDWDSMRLPILP